MGWVERHGTGYRGRARLSGERYSTETFPKKDEARRALRALERELESGVDPRGADVGFAEWSLEWTATRGVLAASTRAGDDSRYRTHLRPAFGELCLGDITPLVVRQWVSELAARRSAKTVRHAHALLHNILEGAVDEGLLRTNPCNGTRLPKKSRRDQVCLTEQERDRLIAAHAAGMPRALATTLAATGVRWGEGAGLRVDRVDLIRRECYIRQTLTEVGGRLAIKDTPKSAAGYRTISLPDVAVDALAEMVAGKPGDALVFTNGEDCGGGCARCRDAAAHGEDVRVVHAVRNRNFRRDHWDPAVKAAGLSKRPTPHDLRHTHVALLISDGHSLTEIQYRLGHASISITSDTYGYLLPRVDEALIASLNRSFRPPADEQPEPQPESGVSPAPTLRGGSPGGL